MTKAEAGLRAEAVATSAGCSPPEKSSPSGLERSDKSEAALRPLPREPDGDREKKALQAVWSEATELRPVWSEATELKPVWREATNLKPRRARCYKCRRMIAGRDALKAVWSEATELKKQ